MRLAGKIFGAPSMMRRNKIDSAAAHLNRFFFFVVFVFFLIGIIIFPLGILRVANGRLIDDADENHGGTLQSGGIRSTCPGYILLGSDSIGLFASKIFMYLFGSP